MEIRSAQGKQHYEKFHILTSYDNSPLLGALL